jgi:hypothetical protein
VFIQALVARWSPALFFLNLQSLASNYFINENRSTTTLPPKKRHYPNENPPEHKEFFRKP